jgi:hypothetical protein
MIQYNPLLTFSDINFKCVGYTFYVWDHITCHWRINIKLEMGAKPRMVRVQCMEESGKMFASIYNTKQGDDLCFVSLAQLFFYVTYKNIT